MTANQALILTLALASASIVVPVGPLAEIKDLAEVRIGKELRTGAASQNGEEVVVGTALMLIGENSRRVAAAVDRKLAEINTSAGRNKRRFALIFAFATLYLIAEVVGGLLTRSLALLADAGHMLTDVAGLGLAPFAIRFADTILRYSDLRLRGLLPTKRVETLS
jgi:AcrB/AcrD/AcrF family protein/cation efflux family protein